MFKQQRSKTKINLTWSSRPPHYPHKGQPYQLRCTSTCPHQQLIEQQSPEKQMENHKGQDQPEPQTPVYIITYNLSLGEKQQNMLHQGTNKGHVCDKYHGMGQCYKV